MRDQNQSPSVAFHPAAARRAVLFGPFRFDLVDKTLSRGGEEIRLPPRALLILDHFLERPNRVVSKQELLDAVWKDSFVGESSLTEAIGVLRQALGDTASGAEYIQTVHRRGYRFVAPLNVDAQTASAITPTLVVTAEPTATHAPGSRHAGVLIAAAAMVAVVGLAAWFGLRPEPPAPLTRATITLPIGQAPVPGLTAQPVAALSPDGQRIVYVAGASGSYRLFLRAIDQFEAIPVPGTDGAHAPFFSPDGKSIGFFVQGRLRVMSLPDGQPIDLADAGAGHGGWWLGDGSIIFATGFQEGIFRIAATGGERRPIKIAGLDGATLRHPTLTADGRTLLATTWEFNVRHSEVVAVDLSSGAARRIARGVHPRALDDGRVIYLRDGDLVAAPLDGSGPEVTLMSGVMTGVLGAGQYSLASNGTLLYLPESPGRVLRQMVRVPLEGPEGKAGQEEPLLFEPRAFQNLVISPDGRRVAATIYERGASDLWVGSIERGILQRLTTEGGCVDPVWSHDGSLIYFAWVRGEAPNLYRVPADGSAPPTLVTSVSSLSPTSITKDGIIFAARYEAGGGTDIMTVAPDGTARDWLATAANESGPKISPDERYVAYRSDKSGRFEVYVKSISGEGPDQQVSVTGGGRPDWSADSRTIFFAAGRSIQRAGWHAGLAGRPAYVYSNPNLVWSRVGATGIILLKALEEERPLTTLNLVVGWTREVARAR